MVKKYTFLFLILAFLFTNVNVLFAIPFSNEICIEMADNSFTKVGDMYVYENAGQDGLSIEEQVVWAANGSIYIRAKKNTEVNIYTITGQLSKQVKVTAGETAISMPRGLYIVRFDNIARKVIVR
ncbi:MAG: T9SS type A sorting domain-containing protein [Tannerella sp.]|jgi:hypothetical protein|nr:T9SS type A sorting domain-containing protein [Tannerella sp.]